MAVPLNDDASRQTLSHPRAPPPYTFHRGHTLVKNLTVRRACGNPTERWADKVRKMNSMPNPKQTDPHDVAVAALKQAYEQIERADRQRVDKQASKLEQDAARHPSDQQKRLAVPGRQSSRGRLALQGLIGLLLAACIGAAVIACQAHRDASKQMIARWAPQLDLTSSPAPENPVPAQPSPPAVQAAAAKATPPQPAPPAQTAPEPPRLAQPLQSTARDLAAAEQDIEQLRA